MSTVTAEHIKGLAWDYLAVNYDEPKPIPKFHMEMSENHELKRVPMPGRDLNITTGTIQDKRRTQLNLPTSISSNQKSQDQLNAVMDNLLGAAKAYDEKRANSINGECIEIKD